MIENLRSMLAYRSFIASGISRDIKAKYANTMLGAAWIFIQPVTMILIYTVIFSKVMHNRIPGQLGDFAYSVNLCAALLPWMFFTDLLTRIQGMYVENANFLKKMHFPRSCLTIIALGTAFFSFAIIYGFYLVFCFLVGSFPGFNVIYIIPVFIVQLLLTLSLGHFLAVAFVYFRDVGHITGLALQLLFWCTPIVYPFSILPAWVVKFVQINPFVGISRYYQNIYLLKQPGSYFWIMPALCWTVLFALLAYWAERRHGRNMVDDL